MIKHQGKVDYFSLLYVWLFRYLAPIYLQSPPLSSPSSGRTVRMWVSRCWVSLHSEDFSPRNMRPLWWGHQEIYMGTHTMYLVPHSLWCLPILPEKKLSWYWHRSKNMQLSLFVINKEWWRKIWAVRKRDEKSASIWGSKKIWTRALGGLCSVLKCNFLKVRAGALEKWSAWCKSGGPKYTSNSRGWKMTCMTCLTALVDFWLCILEVDVLLCGSVSSTLHTV